MIKKVFILLTLFCLNSWLILYSQDFFNNGKLPRFGLLDRSKGLTSLAISSIVQDKYGFLWFGSQGGLNKYDGTNMVTYNHDPYNKNTIANDLIQTLFYDEETNILWIGTYSGLSAYQIDHDKFTHYSKDTNNNNSLSNNIVVSIAKGPEGNIWVGTTDGLNVINKDDKTITKIETSNSTIRTILLDSNNKLWLGTYGGVQYWDEHKKIMISSNLELPSNFVMTIIEPEPNKLLIGMWGGSYIEYWTKTNEKKEHTLPDNRIYTLLQSNDGTLWAGSWGGGLWVKPKDSDPVLFNNSNNSEIANSVIYSLFQDKGGLVWVGTNGGGVHYLSPRRNNFLYLSHNEDESKTLPEGKIDVIHKFNNSLYVAVYGEGLNIYNQETETITKLTHTDNDKTTISDNIVNGIFNDSKNNIWIATNNGLDLYNIDNNTFLNWNIIHPYAKLSHTVIISVSEDSNGNLLIGTYGKGVDIYNPETKKIINYNSNNSNLSDNIIYNILETSDKNIWLTTNDGLNKFDTKTKTFTSYKHDSNDINSISGNNSRSLIEDSTGKLWISTYSSGINCYDPYTDTFKHYTTKEGLSSNNVLAIIEAEDKRIWISTRGGINIIDPFTNSIEVIDESDGLQGVFFNFGSYKDESGALYFGGSHGVTKIDSHQDFKNPNIPDVHITDVSVMGKQKNPSKPVHDKTLLELTYKENYISFDFIALDYETPTKNTYSYILEGFDKNWTKCGTRTYVSYTNIPPGSYRFRVQAANNDKIWNREGTYIDIKISRPWYKTWWAIILYITVIVPVIYIIYKLKYASLINIQNKKLEYTNGLLEKANLKLESLSIHDNLTGLYNRRYFDIHIKEEFQRAKRNNSYFTVLMIDIDNFKIFNDTYGHFTGDKVLTRVSHALQNAASRITDFITRYGGEEFIVVLYDTDTSGALQVAQNIHNEIKQTSFLINRASINITVSIGCHTERASEVQSPEYIVDLADKAMYLAKERGKNRTECLY